MFFGLARLMLFGGIVLTVIYVCLSLYSRNRRREKLIAAWEEENMQGDREAFVRAGLKDYDGSLRRKLILGVYVVPIVTVTVILYLTNYT